MPFQEAGNGPGREVSREIPSERQAQGTLSRRLPLSRFAALGGGQWSVVGS